MHLYAMKSALTGTIKIGRSKRPEHRLLYLMEEGRELGLDMELVLVGQVPLVNVSHEKAVHLALAHARVRGEWFLGCDGAVVSFVNEVIVAKRTQLHVWLAIREIRHARAAGIRPEPPRRSGVSLRECARQIGVSDSAVRKAIASGRLVRSLTKTTEGRPVIADIELARLEWNNSSRTKAMRPE